MADKSSPQDRLHDLIKEVEALAKGIRSNLRQRVESAGVLKEVQKAADQLRKTAASAAVHVEKYVHGLRQELEGAGKPKKKAPAKRKVAKKKAPASK